MEQFFFLLLTSFSFALGVMKNVWMCLGEGGSLPLPSFHCIPAETIPEQTDETFFKQADS